MHSIIVKILDWDKTDCDISKRTPLNLTQETQWNTLRILFEPQNFWSVRFITFAANAFVFKKYNDLKYNDTTFLKTT